MCKKIRLPDADKTGIDLATTRLKPSFPLAYYKLLHCECVHRTGNSPARHIARFKWL